MPDCPLPQFNFDVITIGHGSGGLLTRQLLEEGVFDVLSNAYLDERHDGAILELAGPIAFTTDSFVISPIFFPGGNIGELAVNGTVNDVAMCGAVPRFLSLSFILEEGIRMTEVAEIIRSVGLACARSGVQVVTGDTKVVERGKGDKIFINTTGIGQLHPRAAIAAGNIRVGDNIIVSGPVATHGIAIMSVREGLEFDTILESDSTNLNDLVLALIDELGPAVRFLRDPTRGGIAATLNEIAGSVQAGISLREPDIPMLEPVRGACEMLGLDPLYVANEGIFLAIVDGAHAKRAVEILGMYEKGHNAAIIGEVVEEHAGRVVIKTGIGGRRAVHMPAGELLPRIC